MFNRKKLLSQKVSIDSMSHFSVDDYIGNISTLLKELRTETENYKHELSNSPITLWLVDYGIKLYPNGYYCWIRHGEKTKDWRIKFGFEHSVYNERSIHLNGLTVLFEKEPECFCIGPIEYDTAYDWFMPFGLRVDWSKSTIYKNSCNIIGFSENELSQYELESLEYNIKDILRSMSNSKMPLYINQDLIGHIKWVDEFCVNISKRKTFLIASFEFDFMPIEKALTTPIKHPKGESQ